MKILKSKQLELLCADLVNDKNIIYKFISKIDRIDFLYSAFPQQNTFSFWKSQKGVVSNFGYEHNNIITNILKYIKKLGVKELAIEVGESDFDIVNNFIVNNYNHVDILSIIYSAFVKRGQIVKKKKSCLFFRAGVKKLKRIYGYTYSHEFLQKRSLYNDIQSLFDPCFGNGLILNNFSNKNIFIYGIDYNLVRLQNTIKLYDTKLVKGFFN